MEDQQWSREAAWAWVEQRPWLCGCNYVPSTAVNTTEMWQADTFDVATIDRELGWAASIGMNSCRVFLQYLVWEEDPAGQKARMEEYLAIAARHGMSTVFVLFDDCAFSGKEPYLGKQEDPAPGVHNSCWTPSPGSARVADRAVWPQLEAYLQDLLSTFRSDERIVAWDLYNEPGNSRMGNRSLPLLEASFDWGRSAQPTQPLTVGTWHPELTDINRLCLNQSDVISFHAYTGAAATAQTIAELKAHGRPLLCTEWMARTLQSRFETHLPLFRQEYVGCYCWGLVRGKTQTFNPWGSEKGAPEPELWFHDIFYPEGRHYLSEETAIIRQLTSLTQ